MEQTTKVSLAGLPPGAGPERVKQAVRAAALAATDFAWLSPGQAVFVKPASNSGQAYPATTSPAALGAMVELLREKGAGRVIVGDMAGIEHLKLGPDRLWGSTRRLMQANGLAQAAEQAGAELVLFEEAGWQGFYPDPPPAGSAWQEDLMMPAVLKEAQHIVLLPRCGRHVLAGSTLGLKAAVGYWRTDTRLEYHRDAATLQEKTAEGNWVPTLRAKQRLVLTAADKVLVSFGPDRGWMARPDPGLVVASTSVVAHDMVCLAWLLWARDQAPALARSFLADPYQSQVIAGLANRYVAGRLGGLGPALAAQGLVRNDIGSIWEDRVLRRAFALNGGVPRLALEALDLDQEVAERLAGMTRQAGEG